MIKVAFNQHLHKYGQSYREPGQIPANPLAGTLLATGLNKHKTLSMKH